MSELVQGLLHETFPRSHGVLWIPLELGTQPVQRCHADRAAELSGAENVREHGKEQVDLCDTDPVHTILDGDVEKLLEQRCREVLAPPAIESDRGVDLARRDPDRMRQVP
jgi:hypothetical protein